MEEKNLQRRVKTKKRVVPFFATLATIGGVIILFAFWLFGSEYEVREIILSPIGVLWHDEDAYIVIPKEITVIADRRIAIYAKGIISPFGYTARKLRSDLLIFHVKGKRLERYEIKNFGKIAGGLFPLKGEVYLMCGGEARDWPYMWRWTGKTFERLEKSNAMAIVNAYTPVGDLVKTQGWNISETHAELYRPFNLGSRKLRLVWNSPIRSTEKATVILEELGGGQEILLSVDQSFSRLKKTEYNKLINTVQQQPSN